MKKVVVIVGPTASGKTQLSIKLAKEFSAEIINSDSVQVYKELNIGSAKATSDEMQGVKHHLIDIVSIKDDYSVYHYQKDARKIIDKIELPFVVGGTGLYVKALLYDYQFIEPKHEKSNYEESDVSELYQELLTIDPNTSVEKGNKRRIIRALEIAKSGSLLSEKTGKNDKLYDLLVIYLDLDKTNLIKRLESRLELQLKHGFIDEVLQLRKQNVRPNVIGYREINRYLDNELSYEAMKEEIIRASKMLAKKQKTWFKNQMNAVILNALETNLVDNARKIINEFLRG